MSTKKQNRICTLQECEHFLGGQVGERVCLRGFWSETGEAKKPLLNKELMPIRPAECLPGTEKITWKQMCQGNF